MFYKIIIFKWRSKKYYQYSFFLYKGPIPLWMANNSKKEFRRIFDLEFNGVVNYS